MGRAKSLVKRDKNWRDAHVLTAYDMAKGGNSDRQIAARLGVTDRAFAAWVETRPRFKEALERGRALAEPQPAEPWAGLAIARLPARLQLIWEELEESAAAGSGVEAVEDLLWGEGLRARQHLWLHALLKTNFNVTKACHLLNVTKRDVESWVRGDPGFQELLDEVQHMKKDFVEAQLMGRIAAGDTAAIIYASKCLNRDRGYDPAVEVRNLGLTLTAEVKLEDLDLSLDERRKLLDRVRGKLPPKEVISADPED